MLLPLTLSLLAACTPEGDAARYDPIPARGARPGDPLTHIERLSTGDVFHPGDTEVFRAVLDDPYATVRWEASAGELEVDGAEVRWTLPFEDRATLTATVLEDGRIVQTFPLQIQLMAVAPSATGRVDPSDDETGSSCDLAIDANDVPHIIYRNDWHDQWKYAKFVGGAWQIELIDGPGFGVGDAAANYSEPGIALDSNNVPHVAFARETDGVAYANRIGGTWTVTEIAAIPYDGHPVSIVVETNANNTPYIAFTDDATDRIAIAKKVNNNFQLSNLTAAPAGASNAYYRGGLALANAGTVRYNIGSYESFTGTWSQANGFTNHKVYYDNPSSRSTREGIVHVNNNTYGVVSVNSLFWTTANGTPFDQHFVTDSNDGYSTRDLAYDGVDPRIAMSHESVLELIEPDARGYWTYTVADSSFDTGAALAAALDTSGNLHVCYQKQGAIWFY
jgi:hypothetical protein